MANRSTLLPVSAFTPPPQLTRTLLRTDEEREVIRGMEDGRILMRGGFCKVVSDCKRESMCIVYDVSVMCVCVCVACVCVIGYVNINVCKCVCVYMCESL